MKTVTRAAAHASFFLVALSLADGCGWNTGLRSIAWEPDGGAGTTGTSPASAGAPAGTGGSGGAKADPATLGPSQSWMGTIDGYSFHSGSSAVALTFATDAHGVVKGTIVFGKGTPPPPATDPNVGYPSDIVPSTGYFPGDTGEALAYVAEGYPYAFDGGSFDGHHLRFTTNLFQLWAGWCALQTPPSDGSGSCAPGWGNGDCNLVDPQNGSPSIDCGKLLLCMGGGPCACTASGCGLSFVTNGFTVDVAIAGNTASGSIAGSIFQADGVHLTKD